MLDRVELTVTPDFEQSCELEIVGFYKDSDGIEDTRVLGCVVAESVHLDDVLSIEELNRITTLLNTHFDYYDSQETSSSSIDCY